MKKISIALCLFLATLNQAHAKLQSKTVVYKDRGATMKGYVAWDDSFPGKRPGILVVHEYWGLNDYAKGRAEELAKLGYVAFAADMYGQGRVARHPEEAMALMNAVKKDERIWLNRANKALEVLKSQPNVDADRLAAIGYCFGGATVLKLAYEGADVKAVASFHGVLVVPTTTEKIHSKILILHGADDAYVAPEIVRDLKASLDRGHVDYRFIAYPGAVHSFTVPTAGNDPKKGVAYNAAADRKSWKAMRKLFDETLDK